MIFERTKTIRMFITQPKTQTLSDIQILYIKKEYIPGLFYLENLSYNSVDCKISLNNNITIIFDELEEARFWFNIFCNYDFEGKTIYDIKTEFPEEFI